MVASNVASGRSTLLLVSVYIDLTHSYVDVSNELAVA